MEPGDKSSPADEIVVGPVRINKGSSAYRTIAALLTAASAISGATYGAARYIEIRPLEQKVKDSEASLVSLETERQSLSTELDRLQRQVAELSKAADRPVLTFPSDGSSIVGTQQVFTWEAASQTASGYIFELRDLSSSGQPPVRVNVVRPETKRLFFSLPATARGEYLWRIAPGAIVEGKEVLQGKWSNPSTFSVYDNTLARIQATGQLLVATTPTSYDQFVSSNGLGEYSGFEVELVRELAAEIGRSLDRSPLAVRTSEIPWSGLFSAMQSGEADLAVRSIVHTRAREKQYPGLRFSRGYLTNHQIFITARPGQSFPKDLRGATVAVKHNTFNERAASYLAREYGFNLDSSFTAYGDIYQALREGRVPVAMVDSVLAAQFLKSEGQQLGPILDHELKGLYQDELGSDREEYVIVIHDRGADSQLLRIVNEILASPEFERTLNSLKRRFGIS